MGGFHVPRGHTSRYSRGVTELDLHIAQWAASLGWPGEGVLRLVAAALCGGLVGLERELRGRQAGFRTHMLVSLGSAIAMVVSVRFAYYEWPHIGGHEIQLDPARIAYGVMTGVGFLGAGTIIRTQGVVHGLTTAAGIWSVAAIGLAAGFGLYLFTLVAAIAVVLALWGLDYFELILPKKDHRLVIIRRSWEQGCIQRTVDETRKLGFKVKHWSVDRRDDPRVVEITLGITLSARQSLADFERAMVEQSEWELIGMQEST